MKKLLLIIVLLVAAVCGALAQNPAEQTRSSSVYFAWNKWTITTDSQREELAKALEMLSQQPDATIVIVGWTDPTGSSRANRSMSLRRAESVRDYLTRNGISAGRITVVGEGVDSGAANNAQARRAEVAMTFFVEEQPEPQPAVQSQPEVTVPEKTPEEVVEPEPVSTAAAPAPVVEPVSKHWFSLRTNLIYWLGGMPNIGAEWMPGRSVGILVNGGWAPWASNSWKHNWGAWFVSPEVRVYIGERKQWFLGAMFLGGKYNFKPGDKGFQGTILAGGVTGGYKLPISKRFDMDFSLGLGYGSLEYDTYRHADNGVNVFIEKGVSRNTIMPIQAGVSLIWKIK